MMHNNFPEFLCPYSKRLADKYPRFARQAYDNEKEVAKASKNEAFGIDPFGELSHASKCYGLKQRFPDRVLIMTADKCFMNCRHCTRRGLLGKAEVVTTKAQLSACVNYVKSNPEIRDVLLSGGDILTLPDEKVMEFVEAFAKLPQVDIVRICTRAPSTNPSRVTVKLAKALGKSKKVWVNTQFNVADELTPEARKAASVLVDAGIPVSCQTVLLKGVNDSVEEMLKLLRALTASRIRPYYVFMCDPVAGIGQFRVPLSRARKIERECAELTGGLSMPRFVRDIPGAKRKMPI